MDGSANSFRGLNVAIHMAKQAHAIITGLYIVGVVSLAGLIGFIGQGNVREVPIYYQEKIEQTVVPSDEFQGFLKDMI